jgi:hypothetical protein
MNHLKKSVQSGLFGSFRQDEALIYAVVGPEVGLVWKYELIILFFGVFFGAFSCVIAILEDVF